MELYFGYSISRNVYILRRRHCSVSWCTRYRNVNITRIINMKKTHQQASKFIVVAIHCCAMIEFKFNHPHTDNKLTKSHEL